MTEAKLLTDESAIEQAVLTGYTLETTHKRIGEWLFDNLNTVEHAITTAMRSTITQAGTLSIRPYQCADKRGVIVAYSRRNSRSFHWKHFRLLRHQYAIFIAVCTGIQEILLAQKEQA